MTALCYITLQIILLVINSQVGAGEKYATVSKNTLRTENGLVRPFNLETFEDEGLEKTISLQKIQARDIEWLEDLDDFLHLFQDKKGKWFEINEMMDRILLSSEDRFGKSNFSNPEVVECIEQWKLVFKDARNNTFYALQILDSWARAESGILEGNVRWPGHYYECWGAVGEEIKGKWCNTYMGQQRPVDQPGIPLVTSWGSCFPQQCSENAVRVIIEELLSTKQLPAVLETSCPIPTYYYRIIDVVALLICCILALLIICGTTLEIYASTYRQGWIEKEMNKNINIISEVLKSFSLLSNGRLLLDTTVRPDTLPVLDGLRVVSTTWIILSHWFYMLYNQVDNPVFENKQFRKYISIQPLSNGTFAVDTFFFLSGLLVAYITMKYLYRTKGSLNVALMYLQRYLRLTPLYAFLLLFSMSLYKFFGFGPYWNELSDIMYESCATYWYANLLYINNVFPLQTQLCFGWSWYLANDMQFYILAPLLLIVLYRWKKLGSLLMFLIFAGSVITTGVLSNEASLQPTPVGFSLLASVLGRFVVNTSKELTYDEKFLTDTYNTPWCRICVYIVGMATGYLLYVNHRKIRMNKIVVTLGWLVSATVAMCLIYGLFGYVHNNELMDIDVSVFYLAVCRPLWALCMAWVVVACTSGYGGVVTTMLNWKMFVPLSRLTYSAYLTHLLVIYWYKCVQEGMFHFLMPSAVITYLGILIVTFAISFGLCACVEWPFMRLQKLAFEPLRKKSSKNTIEKTVSISEEEVTKF